jgi:hypothetical protein
LPAIESICSQAHSQHVAEKVRPIAGAPGDEELVQFVEQSHTKAQKDRHPERPVPESGSLRPRVRTRESSKEQKAQRRVLENMDHLVREPEERGRAEVGDR